MAYFQLLGETLVRFATESTVRLNRMSREFVFALSKWFLTVITQLVLHDCFRVILPCDPTVDDQLFHIGIASVSVSIRPSVYFQYLHLVKTFYLNLEQEVMLRPRSLLLMRHVITETTHPVHIYQQQ